MDKLWFWILIWNTLGFLQNIFVNYIEIVLFLELPPDLSVVGIGWGVVVVVGGGCISFSSTVIQVMYIYV